MPVGIANAFGIFQTYLYQHQLKDHTESEVAWIGSIQLFLSFFLGLFSGRVCDSYGPRWLLLAGSLCFFFSLILTGFCKTYWQFFLAQGVLTGIGGGISYGLSFTGSDE